MDISLRKRIGKNLWALFGTIPAAVSARAHVLPGGAGGFVPGLSHPFSGLDHVLAITAVGLWAAQRGGKSLWGVPLTFVAFMILGGILGTAGVKITYVEEGILLSVLVLGILIAAAGDFPVILGQMIAGIFALFHGHSHGTEMPMGAAGSLYGPGFVLSTVFLHALGMGGGIVVKKYLEPSGIRYAGGAVAFLGMVLFFTR